MVLRGGFIYVKPSVWLIASVICVFVPILMREVSVIDKRYSNTNTCLLPPPQSLSVSAQGSNCNLNQQFLSNPILLLIDLLNLIGCLLGGGGSSIFFFVSLILILIIFAKISRYQKGHWLHICHIFQILCFYLVPGSQTPVPKEMIDWWTGGEGEVQECTTA